MTTTPAPAAPTIPGTVRLGDAQYERPFTDTYTGRLMVTVYFDDGDHFTTYGVDRDLLAAWAAHDAARK